MGNLPFPPPLPHLQKTDKYFWGEKQTLRIWLFRWLFFLKRQSVPQRADTSYTSLHPQTPRFSATDLAGKSSSSPSASPPHPIQDHGAAASHRSTTGRWGEPRSARVSHSHLGIKVGIIKFPGFRNTPMKHKNNSHASALAQLWFPLNLGRVSEGKILSQSILRG